MSLYPLQLIPSFHYRIWGGEKLKQQFDKEYAEEKIGESWEVSCVPGFESIIENGPLAGKNLQEVLNQYKEELVGQKVYAQHGNSFPLLIKLLDTSAPLSVQVHPADEYALKHHNSFGKSEMWVVLEVEKNAENIIGFQPNTNKEVFQEKLLEEKLEDILRSVEVTKDDVFYLPAGRVHAIGKGITILEIQQSSDVTYRVYDYNRIDKDGKKRDLHVEQALEVMDYSYIDTPKDNPKIVDNQWCDLVRSPYFLTQKTCITKEMVLPHNPDSFSIIFALDTCMYQVDNISYKLQRGSSIVLPACLPEGKLVPLTNRSEVFLISCP